MPADPKNSTSRVKFGIQYQMLAAFSLVAVMAVSSAIIAWFSVSGSRARMNEIVNSILPEVTIAQNLAKEVKEFVAYANQFARVQNGIERRNLANILQNRLNRMDQLLDNLERINPKQEKKAGLKKQFIQLKSNFELQDQLSDSFIRAQSQLTETSGRLRQKHETFIEIAKPRIRQGYNTFLKRGKLINDKIRSALSNLSAQGSPDYIKRLDDELRIGLETMINMEAGEMRANLEMVATTYLAAGLLHEAASIDSTKRIHELEEQFMDIFKSVRKLRLILSTSTPENRKVLVTAMPILAFGTGENSIFNLRLAELNARHAALKVARENIRLSEGLELSVEQMVENASHRVEAASEKLNKRLDRNRFLQIIAAILAVVITFLVGWFFVGHRVVKRILSLQRAMEMQAEGIDTSIPISGNDEISVMANALGKFVSQRRKAEIELRKAKDKAEKADQAKSEFLANMSHELRTPLNAVTGFSELLSAVVSDPKQQSYLNAIKTAGGNLLVLINDILDLSKIEAGKMDIQLRNTSLSQLFTEIDQIFKVKLMHKNVIFSTDIDSTLPLGLYLDETRLRQVLFNLVGNAVKFTDKGQIQLTAIQGGSPNSDGSLDLIIRVSDTGIGISRKKQESIFDPFEQQEGQSQERFGGTGLGLSICRKLVEMMDGEIHLESELGIGSVFTVELSRVKVSAEDIAYTEEQISNHQDIKFESSKILVVDDIESNRNFLFELLTQYNLDVLTAENGKEAVVMAQEYHPDLILMDIRMPVMDGIKATQKLKSLPDTKDTPIIGLTASTSHKDKQDVVDKGMNICLEKPVKLPELFDQLSQYLDHTLMEPDQKGKPCDDLEINTLLAQKLTTSMELKSHLNFRVLPTLKKLKTSMIIGTVEQLGQELDFIGMEFEAGELNQFAAQLLSDADMFEIEKIKKQIDDLINMIES